VKQGVDVRVHPWTEITRPELCVIGNHVAIDMGFACTTQLRIGDYVHISPHVSVIGGARGSLDIGHFCFVSSGARIICGSELFLGDGLIGPLIPNEYKDTVDYRPVTLENFSGVGANSVIMPGVTLAEGSILGANSFLKTSTEPWTIYAGSPARPIKSRKRDIMQQYARELGYDL
jgi:acetyltransferase-like isoleucine patch superfamily enzyme